MIVLRLGYQSAESVSRALGRFFAAPMGTTLDLGRSLVVIDDVRVRVTTNS